MSCCDTLKTVCVILKNIAWIVFKHLWSAVDIFFDILVAIETVVGIKCGNHAQQTNWQYILAGIALFILAFFGLCLGIGELLMDYESLQERLSDFKKFEDDDDDNQYNFWVKGAVKCARIVLEDIPSLIITCHLRKSVATVTQMYSIIASMGVIIFAALFLMCALWRMSDGCSMSEIPRICVCTICFFVIPGLILWWAYDTAFVDTINQKGASIYCISFNSDEQTEFINYNDYTDWEWGEIVIEKGLDMAFIDCDINGQFESLECGGSEQQYCEWRFGGCTVNQCHNCTFSFSNMFTQDVVCTNGTNCQCDGWIGDITPICLTPAEFFSFGIENHLDWTNYV